VSSRPLSLRSIISVFALRCQAFMSDYWDKLDDLQNAAFAFDPCEIIGSQHRWMPVFWRLTVLLDPQNALGRGNGAQYRSQASHGRAWQRGEPAVCRMRAEGGQPAD
jgi:hypothetical protein